MGGTHPEVGCFHPRQFSDTFYLRQKSECCGRFLSRVAAGRLVPLARARSAAQCGVHEMDLETELGGASCHEQQCRTEQRDQRKTSSVWSGTTTQYLDREPPHLFELCSQICRCNMLRGGPGRVFLRPSPLQPLHTRTQYALASAVSESPTATCWLRGSTTSVCLAAGGVGDSHTICKSSLEYHHTCATNDLSDRSLPTRFRLCGPRLFCLCARAAFNNSDPCGMAAACLG